MFEEREKAAYQEQIEDEEKEEEEELLRVINSHLDKMKVTPNPNKLPMQIRRFGDPIAWG